MVGSRDGVPGASLEEVCVGAMVQHNMERGKFDFKETQTPGMGSGSQICVNSKELMGSERLCGWRHWFSAPRGLFSPVAWAFGTPLTLGMSLKVLDDASIYLFYFSL